MSHPLDRPVWSMLTGPMAPLARGKGPTLRIDPRYGPFAAARDASAEAQSALACEVDSAGDDVWLVEPEPWIAPPGTRVVRTAPLVQMIAEAPAPLERGDEAAQALGEADADAMSELAHATEPGPWGPLTHRYGRFYGLCEGERLVAMAGSRMHPAEGIREVSGVCTAPAHRGRGHAARLIRRVMAEFTRRGEMPFLHSYAGNAGAIALYERLGFRVRRTMILTVLGKA